MDDEYDAWMDVYKPERVEIENYEDINDLSNSIVSMEVGYEVAINIEDTAQEDVNWYYQTQDEEIRRLKRHLIKKTPQNLSWAFWEDDTAQAFAMVITYTIIGDGIRVRPRKDGLKKKKKEKLERIIDDFNNNINERGEDVYDIIHQAVIGNVIHGKQLFKKVFRKDPYTGKEYLSLYEIDMRTISELVNPIHGYRKFVQDHYINEELRDIDRKTFMETYDPFINPEDKKVINMGIARHRVPVYDNEVLFFKFYKKPPMRSIVDLIVYKKWIYYFMKQAAKVRGVPPPVITVGNQQSHPTSRDYPKYLKRAAQIGGKLKNWDALSMPWNWAVQWMEGGRPFDFTPHLQFINRRIVFSLLGSISLLEGASGELHGHVIETVWLRVISAFRRKIARVLEKCYNEVLKMNGINEEVVIEWTPLREPISKAEIAAILSSLFQLNALKDVNELRELFSKNGIIDLSPMDEDEEEKGYAGTGVEELITSVMPVQMENKILKQKLEEFSKTGDFNRKQVHVKNLKRSLSMLNNSLGTEQARPEKAVKKPSIKTPMNPKPDSLGHSSLKIPSLKVKKEGQQYMEASSDDESTCYEEDGVKKGYCPEEIKNGK
ncbi:MAG: hypothetical protein ACTSRA_00265 [Promethearchaeota archaeon]|nr:MAG: FluMu protein [Helarchaeota virus Nidhogg Meg22_1012]URC17388.1 MAG: hypothetical protein [Helarchaeota virus Nidhogg Meg22_1214]